MFKNKPKASRLAECISDVFSQECFYVKRFRLHLQNDCYEFQILMISFHSHVHKDTKNYVIFPKCNLFFILFY